MKKNHNQHWKKLIPYVLATAVTWSCNNKQEQAVKQSSVSAYETAYDMREKTDSIMVAHKIDSILNKEAKLDYRLALQIHPYHHSKYDARLIRTRELEDSLWDIVIAEDRIRSDNEEARSRQEFYSAQREMNEKMRQQSTQQSNSYSSSSSSNPSSSSSSNNNTQYESHSTDQSPTMMDSRGNIYEYNSSTKSYDKTYSPGPR